MQGILYNTLVSPQGTSLAEVSVSFNEPGFITVEIDALAPDTDNVLARTMAMTNARNSGSAAITEWTQTVAYNPATLALAHLLLDSQALNQAAGHVVFADYVAKVIAAIDTLWD